jgi:hypothetical protein
MASPDTPHFDLPFKMGKSGTVVQEQDSIDDIANCVVAILITHFAWRDEAPTFGTVDLAMRKMPIGSDEIMTLIGTQEPRAILVVEEHPDQVDSLVARINIGVSVYTKGIT